MYYFYYLFSGEEFRSDQQIEANSTISAKLVLNEICVHKTVIMRATVYAQEVIDDVTRGCSSMDQGQAYRAPDGSQG